MSDTTWGVKVSEELKGQIIKLIEQEGIPVKDFMQNMVNVYNVEKAKQQMPEVAVDLKELQTITQRINNIYLNIGYRIETLVKDKEEQISKDLSIKETLIFELREKIAKEEDKNKELEDNCSSLKKEKELLLERSKEIKDNLETLNALLKEYKEKNELLSEKVSLLEPYKDKIVSLEEMVENQFNQIRDLEAFVSQLQASEKKIIQEKEDMQKVCEASLQEAYLKFEEQLHKVEEQKQLELDKAILKKEKDHANSVKELQEEYMKEIKSQQTLLEEVRVKHSKEIASYQDKLEEGRIKYSNEISEYQRKWEEEREKHSVEIVEYQEKYRAILQEVEKMTRK